MPPHNVFLVRYGPLLEHMFFPQVYQRKGHVELMHVLCSYPLPHLYSSQIASCIGCSLQLQAAFLGTTTQVAFLGATSLQPQVELQLQVAFLDLQLEVALPWRRGDEEVLPQGELILDGLVPPPLVKFHQRLSKRTELLKLHLKHYHMSTAQFRRRTSELYLPEGVYRLYDGVVKDCEICQKTKPAPPRSRFSGVRAKDFGDVVFMDHCEIKHMTKKHQLFLVLHGATSLLWGATQQEGTQPVTQDLCREWMTHIHSCKPKWVVADMAFFTPSWMTFWKTHGVKTMPTGRATPWPNRAETAVRLFKRQYEKLLIDASAHLTLNKVTPKDLIRECCWAGNTTLTISGHTPVDLAAGRRPTDRSDLELMKPDQLSAVDLARDSTLNELKKLVLRAHLAARQSADLRRDLARRVLPSDGPYAHGDRVFVWIDDKA